MSVDPRHLKEANRRLETRRAEHQAQRALFEAQCRERLPRLAQLDSQIAGAVTRAIHAALRRGEDPTAEVEAARKDSLALQAERRKLLLDAGIDPEQLEDTPFCPICHDTGRHKGGLCECVKVRCADENRKELSRQLDLGVLRWENFSLEWYSPRPDQDTGVSPRECMETVLAACRDYGENFPNGAAKNLYLYGGTGLGKTFLSGCIAGEVCRRGYWTVYETAAALFRRYEAAKFQNDPEALADVRRYESCDLLVLDDLGSEMTTDFVRSALYQVLNQRMLSKKHTVISSNLTMKEVEERYTPQAASRIEGEFRALPFMGEDIRVRKKNG